MSFGIGFRHRHYAELLENPAHYKGELDFLEVHSENFFGASLPVGGAARAVLLQARTHFPVSLHGVGLSLGSALGIDAWHLNQLADLVQMTEPILVSDHACFARGHLSNQGELHASDLLPISFTQDSLDLLCTNVQRVQGRLKRTIAVENLSAYFVWREADFSEPEFLNRLARRTGCQLLIDVNNIYVNSLNDQTAQNLPRDSKAAIGQCLSWLAEIEPKHVVEIHLAGHSQLDDLVIDDHSDRVCAPVWEIYAAAKSRFAEAHTLVEWDTDVPELAVLLEEVKSAKAVAASKLCLAGATA